MWVCVLVSIYCVFLFQAEDGIRDLVRSRGLGDVYKRQILLGTNGLLLWQFFDKKNSLDTTNQALVTTMAERESLQAQLNQVKAEFEKAKADNAGLQNQLSEKDDDIKAKVAEIQKLISLGGPAQIARAKAELAKLKEMNTVYVGQIAVSYTHLRAHETVLDLVCRLLLEKKKTTKHKKQLRNNTKTK